MDIFINFTGTALLASAFTDEIECRVPQGFVFTLDKNSKPFSTSPLSKIIRPNGGFKHLQIYHSLTGGQIVSAQDQNRTLRFLEWQTQKIQRILIDLETYVPELQSSSHRWKAVADEMLTTVTEARRLLSSASDWLQLKVLVDKLDDNLDTIARAFHLLAAQLEPYRNRKYVDILIDRFIRLKVDLPNTISLAFFRSSMQQNFAGLRFLLVAKVCHKRLCFPNIKSSIWSLNGNQCANGSSRQEAGLVVEGKALGVVSLGSVITFPAGGTLKLFLARDSKDVLTTFEGLVSLLGLTKNATVKMSGNELSIAVAGLMFGKFDALLNITAQHENVVDWKSIVFVVEGTMNKSSRFYTLLEDKITNEATMWAKEATQRVENAQATFDIAKKKAELANDVLKSKQSAVEELKIKKEKAAEELRVARFNYHLAKVRFNRTLYFIQNAHYLMCEIQECNYTCLQLGCVIPNMCQNPINITYIEEQCETVEKTIMVEKVQTRTEKRSFTVPTFKVIYTGNCRPGISPGTVIATTIIGAKIGGPLGAVIGFGVGLLSNALFGCSDTYEQVPGEPRIVEYYKKIFEKKEVEVNVKEVECTGHTEKSKPSGYGPPYQCCKERGCETKVKDPQCIRNNQECLESINELEFILDAKNVTLQSQFLSLTNSIDEVKKATFSSEKARVRHESAVTLLKQVEARAKQQLSAVEITNASMLHVRRIVDFGLKIAQALNASDNEKVVDVDEMQFSLALTPGSTKQIVLQTNARTASDEKTPIRFLVDFDQVERSISSASKTIIAKLFGDKHPRRKRSVPEDLANSTQSYSLHSSFLDYRYACLFVNKTHLYLSNMFQSLGDLIASVRGLSANLSSGLHELERLSQIVNISSSVSNSSSVNGSSGSNSSFVTEYLEMIQVLKDENTRLNNDSSQSWNDTLEAWRAFLEVFTSGKGFSECSGTQDCIDYFFEGAKEFYEFEDSPRALEIKDAILKLRELTKLLTTEALSMLDAEQALNRIASLLNKTRDDSVLCGGTPRITFSSQGEVILFPGESLTLNCSAEKEEKLTYSWKRNNKLIRKSVDGTFYAGEVNKHSEGAYVCVVSNNKGSTLSNVTIVKVHGKPKVTQHPQPQRVVFKSQLPATFICNATAEPSPTFQWFFQPANSPAIKLNATKPVLYMANPHLHQEGYYYCEASNEHGSAVSQGARLDVLRYTIGLPRLLIAFNLTTQCWLASNSSNSSAQDPLPCDSEPINILPSSLDRNLTNNLLCALASSLNVSIELISGLQYDSGNASKSSVAFVIDVDNEPSKEDNFTTYIEIVEAIAVAEANMLKKLKQFNSDVFNKTFKVPWNATNLLGEPGSIMVYPLSPECPEGQFLSGNGYICGTFHILTMLNLNLCVRNDKHTFLYI